MLIRLCLSSGLLGKGEKKKFDYFLGVLNKSALHNQSTLHHAIVNRQKGQGLITVSNHTSYLDAFLVPREFPRNFIIFFKYHVSAFLISSLSGKTRNSVGMAILAEPIRRVSDVFSF